MGRRRTSQHTDFYGNSLQGSQQKQFFVRLTAFLQIPFPTNQSKQSNSSCAHHLLTQTIPTPSNTTPVLTVIWQPLNWQRAKSFFLVTDPAFGTQGSFPSDPSVFGTEEFGGNLSSHPWDTCWCLKGLAGDSSAGQAPAKASQETHGQQQGKDKAFSS